MENLIGRIGGIIVLGIIFSPLLVGLKKDKLKKIIDENPGKISDFSIKKFFRTLKFVAENKNFFLGYEDVKEKEIKIQSIFHEALLSVCREYLHKTSDLCDLSDRLHFIFRELNKRIKDDREIRKIIFSNDKDVKKVFENILLDNKYFIEEIIRSFVERGEKKDFDILVSPYGVLSIIKTLKLDAVRLSYLDKLKVDFSEKIEK